MITKIVDDFAAVSASKLKILENSFVRYFLLSVLAGVYVGFGIILIFSIGAPLGALGSGFLKLLMGVSFGIALTLVVFGNAELFTGNNMVMAIGAFDGKVTWKSTLWLWLICYAGNFAGSILLALVFVASGLSNNSTSAFVIKAAEIKIMAPFWELFFRGILCNMLICLAIWMSQRTKEDIAKIFLIFWCLFAFIASGFEHCVANMTLLCVAYFSNLHHPIVSISGIADNLIPVSLGNIVGGAFIIGLIYWYIGRGKTKTLVRSKLDGI